MSGSGRAPATPPRRPFPGRLARFALLLAGTLLSLPALGDTDRRLQQAELDRLRSQIESARTRLETVRSEYDTLRDELRDTERRIGRLLTSLRTLDRQLDQQRAHLAELERERETQEQALAAHRELLARQVRAAYAIGRQEYAKMLLNQQDPAELGRVLTYYDYFNRARSAQIETIGALLAALREVQGDIERERARHQTLYDRQRREKADLEASREARGQVLAKLNREIQTTGRELNRLLEDEARLERLVEEVQQALLDIPAVPGHHQSFASLKGRLPRPAAGRVSIPFGADRGAGRLSWQGVMLEVAEGQEVRAVAHGRVAFADWLRGYGLLVIIDHGDGYMSLYGHNQNLHREAGDWVEAGELIARAGNSGGRMQTGLYFEIRHNGRPTNPQQWWARR